jgi:hypothetical protein
VDASSAQSCLIEQEGLPGVSVPGQNRVYRLSDHPEAAAVIRRVREAVGKTIVIDGTVRETPERDSPIETIQVEAS